MNLHYNKKFLVRPRPFENEFILSYLERVRYENSYSTIGSVCLTIFKRKISLLDVVKGNFDINLLCQYTLLGSSQVENMCINEENFHISINLFICAQCLSENKYVEKNFYKKNTICYKHLIPIISRCPYCNNLFDWSILSKMNCKKCFKKIKMNPQYLLNVDASTIDIFYVYTKILKYKKYLPNSISFSLRNFVKNFNFSNNFLINKDMQFEIFIRKYYFRDTYFTKEVNPYAFDYLNFMISLEFFNKSYKFKHIKIQIDNYSLLSLNDDIFNHNFNFNMDKTYLNMDYKKHFFLSIENCAYILRIDSYLLELLCKNNILNIHLDQYIDIFSFFKLCIEIKMSSSSQDINKDFVWFKDLEISEKVKFIWGVSRGFFIIYNFNIMKVFSDIKVHVNDLAYPLLFTPEL